MDERRLWMRLAAASGFVSVAAGTFAAHGIADPAAKEWLRTGASYEAIHALAALLAIVAFSHGNRRARLLPPLFLGGSLLFSGSLYAMALGAPHWMGAVTPIGGLAFLAGWAGFAWAAGDAGPAP
jgi:uncharacterized membrane protein YgdD (TMEM256/DUF423 family)